MGCNCSKGRAANVAYQVKFGAGTPDQKYDTLSEAQAALTAAGRPAGSSITAVAK